MKRALLILLCCLFVKCLSAQSRQPFFYQIYADNGLSSDNTTRVIQDYKGFVWVGTEEGLNRVISFSEFDIHKFKRGDSTSLSNDYITTLFEDSQKRLWVGTNDGLNLYNREKNAFSRLTLNPTRATSEPAAIFDINEDEEGNLWIIRNKELVRLDGTTLSETGRYTAKNQNGNPLNLVRISFFESRLRVGTSRGVFTLAGSSLQQSDFGGDNAITDLITVGNELWMATVMQGVIRYNAISGKKTAYHYGKGQLTSNHVTDLTLVDEDKIWVSTLDGISILDPQTNATTTIRYDFENAFSISDKMIRQVYQDRAGIVWITTPNSGVNYYHKADNLFAYYGQSHENGTDGDLMDYALFSLYSRASQVWIGSRKGLSWFDGNKFKHYPLQKSFQQQVTGVYSIAEGKKGELWLGTDNGLLLWSEAKKNYQSVLIEHLKGKRVNVLSMDLTGNLWIGTERYGVKVYNTVSKKFSDFKLHQGGSATRLAPEINEIEIIDTDRVLIGTSDGLYHLAESEAALIPLRGFDKEIPDNIPINTIYKGASGQIYVGTQQDGLLVFDSELTALHQLGMDDGTKSNNIRSIAEDGEGALWLATNAGVSKVSTNAKGVFDIKNYDIQDGLQSNHFAERSSAVMEDGRILLGGLSGLTIFHPTDVSDFSITQNPNFISLTINGKKVKTSDADSPLSSEFSMTDNLDLLPRQNNFTFGFRALDYLRPDDVSYRYKLEGYQDDWITQKGNTVTFQNLETGFDYVFVLQSKGRFSDWSEARRLTIRVKPYYHEMLWFRSLIALILLGLLTLLVISRTRVSNRRKRELEMLVQERSAELSSEVNIRRETEKKLTEALSEAEKASEIKSKFLANMSHEIRTPLNGILGMTELSLDTDLDSEQRDMLNTVYKSANSLKSIVSDVLDIAKIEAGQLKIENEKFNIRKILDETMASFKVEAVNKRLTLKHWVLPKVPETIFGDAGRIRQVLVNLISNAMKFTHAGGITVIVEAMNQRATGLELWFTVTDTGIGIPQFQLQNIFESFVQLDSGPTRVYGGTGLGLSISKELVEKMGGEIWVESEEGKGSIFSFYIKVEEFIIEESLTIPDYSRPSESVDIAGHVLLVEDSPTNQQVVIKMLERKGVEVTCVGNGKEALSKLQEGGFDLVLMDLQMPEIDGYETTRLIRKSDYSFSNIPIVALTAAAMDGEQEKCRAAGMNGYLAKPVSSLELITAVSPYLSQDEQSATPSA